MHKKSDLSNNKQMIKTKKTQLSTDHRSLTNQTHSDSEIREYGFAKKSQETKVKTKVTRRAFEILRLFMHENEDKKDINQWSKKLL
jgi:hypothetical protein